MVKNEKEPGGGPFWVEGADKTPSVQIVESAQVVQVFQLMLQVELGLAFHLILEVDRHFLDWETLAFDQQFQPNLPTDGLNGGRTPEHMGRDCKEACHNRNQC